MEPKALFSALFLFGLPSLESGILLSGVLNNVFAKICALIRQQKNKVKKLLQSKMKSRMNGQLWTESCMEHTEILLKVKLHRAIAVLQKLSAILRPQTNKVNSTCDITKMDTIKVQIFS